MGDGSDGFGGDANFDGSMGFGDTGGLGNTGNDSFGSLGGEGFGDLGGQDTGSMGVSFNDTNFNSPFNFDGSMSFGDMGGLGNIGQDSFGSLGDGLGINGDDDGFSGKLLGFLTSKGTQAALNALGVPGMVSSIAGIASNAAHNGPVGAGQGFGSLAGTLAGTAFGGPLGGFLGGQLGSALGGAGFGGAENAGQGFGGSNSSNGPGNAGGGGSGLNDILQALGGAYMGNRATGQYNSAINSLNDLYSPNSPYAQMMRQQLERRDAASGRRSQYGNREVELAAALANSHAQALTSNGYGNLMKQRGTAQNQGLNTLLALMSKGGPLNGLANKGVGMVQNGLSSLFNNNNGGDVSSMFSPVDMSTGVDFNQPEPQPFDLGGWGG
jgi:hypothetical protein